MTKRIFFVIPTFTDPFEVVVLCFCDRIDYYKLIPFVKTLLTYPIDFG